MKHAAGDSSRAPAEAQMDSLTRSDRLATAAQAAALRAEDIKARGLSAAAQRAEGGRLKTRRLDPPRPQGPPPGRPAWRRRAFIFGCFDSEAASRRRDRFSSVATDAVRRGIGAVACRLASWFGLGPLLGVRTAAGPTSNATGATDAGAAWALGQVWGLDGQGGAQVRAASEIVQAT